MSEMLMTPVVGRSLWTRSDLQGRESDWRWAWTLRELRDIDSALARVQSRGLGCGDFSKADFELPLAGKRLAAARQEIMRGRGFAVLSGLPVYRYTLGQLETIYWGLGCHLGRAITQNDQGKLLTHVTMDPSIGVGETAPRGYQDRRYQEPHNDRADLVGLLCLRKAKQGGLSSIVNSYALYNDVLRRHPEYLPVFYRGYRIQRGPNNISETPAQVFNHHAGRIWVWFSSRNIERAMKSLSSDAVTELEREAFDYLTQAALNEDYRIDMDLQPGDMQLVNNYAVLHSRTEYEDFEDPSQWRLLLRLWLNLEDMEIDPEFAKYSRRTLYPNASERMRAA